VRLCGYANESYICSGEFKRILGAIDSCGDWLEVRRALSKIGEPLRILDVPNMMGHPLFVDSWIMPLALKMNEIESKLKFEFIIAKVFMMIENPMWKWVPVFTSEKTLKKYEKAWLEIISLPDWDPEFLQFNKTYKRCKMKFKVCEVS